MPGRLRGDVWLFVYGGLKILEHIRAIDYDVWKRRPKVSRLDQLRLLAGCVLRSCSNSRVNVSSSRRSSERFQSSHATGESWQ